MALKALEDYRLGDKLWRLSLTAILGFGWMFLTPAYSDDPLQIAASQISQLESDVQKLTDQAKTQELIDLAKSKYSAAVVAKQNMQDAQTAYDTAVSNGEIATTAKNNAQSAVDAQQTVRDSAYTNLQNKQDALDIANINLSNTPVPSSGSQGVSFRIYPLSRSGNTAYLSQYAGLMCQGALPYFYTYAGDGAICGSSQNIIGIFNATLTIPEGINDVYFAGYTDDGFKLYVNGALEVSNWREQGGTWSQYSRHFDTSTNKTLQLEVWWYNGGGPGVMTVGWGYNGIWTGIPSSYLSYGQGSSQGVIDTYNQAVSAQQDAQTNYNNALSTYNVENDLLIQYNQNLTTAEQNLTIANENLTAAEQNLTNSTSNYNTAVSEMQTAIINAQTEYNKQWDFEEKQRVAAAIAQALANQPQPTPEPTVIIDPTPEPTVEPSVAPTPTPEQTKPNDPTPEPTPETKPSVEPTPNPTPEPSIEPSPEPSPQPTDINPSPISEPTQDPVVIPDKTDNSPVSPQMANLIADITNSNTLTKLTPEQKIAIAGTLGIKTEELAKVAELAKADPNVGQALQEFGDRANANLNAPMPYTLADATTEVAAEKFLSDPIGALTNIDLTQVLSPSEWGKDMTDDQREKAQEVIVPVIIASNLVAAAMTRRIK